MPEDEVVEAISYIETMTKQEKLEIFAYLFDELIQSDSDSILQIEWDWIEDLLPELCENVRGILGMGHN